MRDTRQKQKVKKRKLPGEESKNLLNTVCRKTYNRGEDKVIL